MAGGLQPQSIYFSAAVYILLSITTVLGNSLILVAPQKESSLHPPSKLLCRCLTTTDLLVGIFSQPMMATYFMSTFTTSYTFCGVSLLTMTAISVDRLLALLLGLRYRQTVTLKRTYIMVPAFWVLSSLTGLCCILNYRIALWLGHISISLFLLISITSYAKIFRTLSHHQAEVQHHVQQRLSQPNALNMVKYRKAVYSALWVQFALVVCYIQYFLIETLISQSNTDSLHLVVFWRLTIGLVQLNSTLNPFLYCW